MASRASRKHRRRECGFGRTEHEGGHQPDDQLRQAEVEDSALLPRRKLLQDPGVAVGVWKKTNAPRQVVDLGHVNTVVDQLLPGGSDVLHDLKPALQPAPCR